jgi:DNA-binding IclR family transcriptional regulator
VSGRKTDIKRYIGPISTVVRLLHDAAVEGLTVRRDRLTTSYEETIEGVVGIAAPILDKSGDVLAGLVIGIPTSRALPRIEVLERHVKAVAEISALIGYANTWSS